MEQTIRDKRVFISYRRDDPKVEGIAHVLYNRLIDKYQLNKDDIFLDHNSIGIGEDFAAKIRAKISQSDIVLVLIGQDYTSLKLPGDPSTRIKKEGDYVRLEVAEALQQNKHVIPVLINGTSMPSKEDLPADLQALRSKNASYIRSQTLNEDIDTIAKKANILMWRLSIWAYVAIGLCSFIIVYLALEFLG